jgi:xylan 1,4-beta-xylosidase
MYSSYSAASFGRELDIADRHGVNLEGALTWAFEFEDQPYFAGFRALASNGIPLPVFNVFRMFSRMGAQQVEAASDGARSIGDILTAGVREQPDVGVLASRDARRITILAWHYHDDDVPGPAANVTMTVEGLGASDAMVRHLRVDAQHGNAYTAWLRMGSPETPSREQYVVLERASELAELQPPTTLSPSNGRSEMQFALPRQAVSLLIVEW